MSQAAQHESSFNALDPHGAQGNHHGHIIVGWRTLVIILFILLFFTGLTVFFSQAEQWVAATWDVHIPGWINIVGAMTIATIKATLVCAYFMQLRYDKPFNTFVMLFCLLGVFLFLFFAMIDLGNRHHVTKFRAEIASPGGTGFGIDRAEAGALSARVSPHISTGGTPIAAFRYEQAVTNFFSTSMDEKDGVEDAYENDPYYLGDPEKAFWHWYYQHTYVDKGKTPHHHERDVAGHFDSFVDHHHDELNELGLLGHHDDGDSSDANRSRPRSGLTPGLFDAGAHGDDAGHGADDETHGADEQSGESHGEESGDDNAPADDHGDGG